MRRREYIALGGAIATWPLTGRAQQSLNPTIGLLGSTTPESYAQFVAWIRLGLSEAGDVEGKNLAMPGGHRGLRHRTLLLAGVEGTWPYRPLDACSLREALPETPEERCHRCGGDLRSGRPMFGPVDFSVANDRQGARREQAAQIAITTLRDTTKLLLATARVLLGHQPNPGREVPS